MISPNITPNKNGKETIAGTAGLNSVPFLFGVMFGDIMHGALLAIVGMYLIMAKAEKGSLAHKLAPVKYLFFMMGLFSFYCGLIYNDFTSLPIMISDTCWEEPAK
jgi:V-type H+-transporting ATPase subunit a